VHAHALSVGSLGSHQTGRAAGEDAAGASHAASLRRAAAGASGPADEEDAASADWRAHRKHVFVLTNAGRPVWTLHGREDALVGFMAIVDAMLAFAQTRGDAMRSIRCAHAATSSSEYCRVPLPCSVWGCSKWSGALPAGACVRVRGCRPLRRWGAPLMLVPVLPPVRCAAVVQGPDVRVARCGAAPLLFGPHLRCQRRPPQSPAPAVLAAGHGRRRLTKTAPMQAAGGFCRGWFFMLQCKWPCWPL